MAPASLVLRGKLARPRYHLASEAASTALVTLEAPVTLERCPVDCVVVLDVSGSMGGTKLKLCGVSGLSSCCPRSWARRTDSGS
jgi:hypothetical protein